MARTARPASEVNAGSGDRLAREENPRRQSVLACRSCKATKTADEVDLRALHECVAIVRGSVGITTGPIFRSVRMNGTARPAPAAQSAAEARHRSVETLRSYVRD